MSLSIARRSSLTVMMRRNTGVFLRGIKCHPDARYRLGTGWVERRYLHLLEEDVLLVVDDRVGSQRPAPARGTLSLGHMVALVRPRVSVTDNVSVTDTAWSWSRQCSVLVPCDVQLVTGCTVLVSSRVAVCCALALSFNTLL
eukprot:3430605-Rhodomonas_salina.2